MTLDIAMGGSTNTVLHILAAAQEGGVDFTMADIDRLSRQAPNICKVAPSTDKYMSKMCIGPVGSWGFLANWTAAG